MRVLLLGASGFLGSYLADNLPVQWELLAPRPRSPSAPAPRRLHVLPIVLGACMTSVRQLIISAQPDIVINCAAVLDHRQAGSAETILINSALPHLIADAAAMQAVYLVHMSTDAVFSGATQGPHVEEEPCDAADLYGRSKALGEVSAPLAINLRTTIVGSSSVKRGLVDWLRRSRGGAVDGYANYLFTPLSLKQLARVIVAVADRRPCGIYHAGGSPLSKFDFAKRLSSHENLCLELRPVLLEKTIDRRLDSSRLWREIELAPPTIDDLIGSL